MMTNIDIVSVLRLLIIGLPLMFCTMCCASQVMLRTTDLSDGFEINLDTEDVDTLVADVRQYVEGGYPLLANFRVSLVEVVYHCQKLECNLHQVFVRILVESRPNLIESAFVHYESVLWLQEKRASIDILEGGSDFISSPPPVAWGALPIRPDEAFPIAVNELRDKFVSSDEEIQLHMTWRGGSDMEWDGWFATSSEALSFTINVTDGTFSRASQ